MKRHRSNTFVPLILIGSGLIALGIMAFIYLGDKSTSQIDLSAVPVEVNYAAPQMELKDINGNSASLAAYRGQVVLVNLWATWCPPCKAEMPTLQSFYEKYKEDGFVILGIDDGETLEQVRPFVDEYGLTFPVLLDEGYTSERNFGTINLPSSWVVDRTGRIRLSWVGAISRKVLEKYVPPIIME